MNSILPAAAKNRPYRISTLVESAARAALNQEELWYVQAHANVPGGMVSLQADASTILSEPGWRRIHIGLHPQQNIGVWNEAIDCFSAIAKQYSNKGSIRASAYVEHPESNNGLTVQIQPADKDVIEIGVNPFRARQVNQIIGGRGAHIGYWRSGARIKEMPLSAVPFTQQVLKQLSIDSTAKATTVHAQYAHQPTTTDSQLMSLYQWGIGEQREVEVNLDLLEDGIKPAIHRIRGNLALHWARQESYFGMTFGKRGHYSWDKNVPDVAAKSISVLEEALSYLTCIRPSTLQWTVSHSCNGRDRGKNFADAHPIGPLWLAQLNSIFRD